MAILSVTIAAFSHVAGGGAAPGVLGTILAVVAAAFVSIALSSRALSTARLAVAVTISQFVFHLLFSLGADLPSAVAGEHVGMLGMVMSGGSASGLPALSGAPGPAMDDMSDVRMWAGHAAAAVVTIALLLHGERAVLTLARLATSRLALLVTVVSALPQALPARRPTAALSTAAHRGLHRLDVMLVARPRRGPPVLV